MRCQNVSMSGAVVSGLLCWRVFAMYGFVRRVDQENG